VSWHLYVCLIFKTKWTAVMPFIGGSALLVSFWCLLIRKVGKGKGKVHLRTGHECPEGEQKYSPTISLTSALDWGRRLTPRPGHFTPGKDLVPNVQEAGWPPGSFWTVRKTSPSPGFDPRTVQPVAIPTTLPGPPFAVT
jgi:hypothetical protein